MSHANRVTLNVGGRRYVTLVSTLRNFPDTFLGTMFSDSNIALAKPDENGEYFFDRNGDAFNVILEYYRNGGKLMLPVSWELYSPEMLSAELDYFQIPFEVNLLQTSDKRADPLEFSVLHGTRLIANRYLYIDRLVANRARSAMEIYGSPLLSIIWFSLHLFQIQKFFTHNLIITLKFAKEGPRTLSSFFLKLDGGQWPGRDLPAELNEIRNLDWTMLQLFLDAVPSLDPEEPNYLHDMEWHKLRRAQPVFVKSLSRAVFGESASDDSLSIFFKSPIELIVNFPGGLY